MVDDDPNRPAPVDDPGADPPPEKLAPVDDPGADPTPPEVPAPVDTAG